MDALDKIISEKRAEAEQLRERIRVLEAELSTLQLAAKLRPAATSKRAGKSGRAGGGRRPGDISHDWRAILAEIYRQSKPACYSDIRRIASCLGNELAESSVRDRVRNLVKTGLMTGDPKDGFSVTENAAERFGFAKENSGSAEPEEANAEGAVDAPGVLDLQPKPDEAHEKGVPHVASRFDS